MAGEYQGTESVLEVMRTRRLLTVVAGLIALASIGLGEEHLAIGSIVGRVFNQGTKEPIPYANVVVLGFRLGAATGKDGRFTIPKVPVGSYVVRISMIGYEPLVKTVTVHTSTELSELEFSLKEGRIELGEVQVNGNHFSRTPDVPLSTRSFTNKELRHAAGGLDDVVRAIKILPGVAQVKADRADLIVRGGAPSENLFLIDNVDVPYINHFSTQGSGGGAVSIVDMSLLSGSTFSTGGFGVYYGDRLSSVLSIELREGKTDGVHGKAIISPTQLGLNVEGPLSQNGSYLVSIRRSYLDLAFKLYGFGYAPHFWDFLGKATYSLGMKDKLAILVVGAIDKIEFFNETDEHRYENSRLLFSNQKHLVVAATWQRWFSNGYATVTLRQVKSTFDYISFTEDLTPRFQSSSNESEISLRGNVNMQYSASTELEFGIESQGNDVQSAIDSKGDGNIFVGQSLNGTPSKAAVYAQIANVIGNLKMTFGLRADYFSLIDRRAVVSPRISSILALSPQTNLTASIGQYHQSPSYVWLAANPFNRGLSHIGVNQFVVGIDHLVSPELSVNLEGYIKRYFNYPTSLNEPSLIMANAGSGPGGFDESFPSFGLDSLVSRGRGLARGIELSMQKKLSEIPCYGMLSLSYSEARFTALDGVSRPSDYDQRFMINIGGGYLIGENWEVSGRFRLYTGRPYTPFRPDGSWSQEEYNSARVGVNHQLDVRVARHWTLKSAVLEAYLDVQNVYNRKPTDAPIFSERRKRVEQVPTLGIVPTVGIGVQF
ncbi:MAG: TonB-dependent receptor [Ignavibacteria bacterium]|nr:TonB-dependent receptor [Ignavibacteria bacterium]